MAADATEHTGRAAVGGVLGRRRRRRPNPAEQARREAWGRRYGAVMREIVQEHKGRQD